MTVIFWKLLECDFCKKFAVDDSNIWDLNNMNLIQELLNLPMMKKK